MILASPWQSPHLLSKAPKKSPNTWSFQPILGFCGSPNVIPVHISLNIFPYAIERLSDAWVCVFLKQIYHISLAHMALLQEVTCHTVSNCRVRSASVPCFYSDILPVGLSHGRDPTVWLLFKDIISCILRPFFYIEAISFMMFLFLWTELLFICMILKTHWTIPVFISDGSRIILPYVVTFAFLPVIYLQFNVFFNLVFIRLLTFPVLNQISSFQSSINHLLRTSHSHCFYCYCHPTRVLHSRREQPCSQPLAHDSSFHVPFFPQLMLSLPPVLAEEYLSLRNRTLISSLCSSHY